MSIWDTDVDFSHFIKILGVTLDGSLSMHQLVTTSTTAYVELRRISSIRQHVIADARKHSFRPSYFPDWTIAMLCCQVYLNSLLDRLRRYQTAAAGLIVKASESDHMAALLHSLHWLPVSARIKYKIYSPCHNSLSDSGP